MITVSIIAMGFFIFSIAVKYLPIFENEAPHAPARVPAKDPELIQREIPRPSHVAS